MTSDNLTCSVTKLPCHGSLLEVESILVAFKCLAYAQQYLWGVFFFLAFVIPISSKPLLKTKFYSPEVSCWTQSSLNWMQSDPGPSPVFKLDRVQFQTQPGNYQQFLKWYLCTVVRKHRNSNQMENN